MTTVYKLFGDEIQEVSGDIDLEAYLADGWSETKSEEYSIRENELNLLSNKNENKIAYLEEKIKQLEALLIK